MASIRLVKIAKELNVGTSTIVDFLIKKGFIIKNKPTEKISNAMHDALLQEFSDSMKAKEKADKFIIGSRYNETADESGKGIIEIKSPKDLLQIDIERDDQQIAFVNNADNNDDDIEDIDESSGDGLIEKPFDPTLIKIETKTPSMDTLIKRIKAKSIQMNTATYFQRSDDLWDKVKQSRLIESILLRFPLPAFFFDASDDDEWLVVDGLQRLSSIRNFVVDKSQPLTNMEFLTHLNGKYWDDLPANLQRVIEESDVVTYKIMPGTPTAVKFNIFKRINTGGLILEAQEIRHALFQGKPAIFVHELAQSEAFVTATSGKIKTRRMLDRNFANRFLAFYMLGVENYGSKDYGQDLDTFMSNAMAEIYEKSDEELEEIKNSWNRAMTLANDIFGVEAFRKIRWEYNRLPPINKALFDALSTQLALLTPTESTSLLQNKDKFKSLLRLELAENEEFFASVTSATGDRKRVHYRHEMIEGLIHGSYLK